MAKHKLLDLFSGIGGFSLAADKFGIETIAFVEKEPFCQKVLKKHWNDVPIIDDIRKVKGEDYDSATIVSGGFPCQPFSVAGKRKGTDDDRYLWDETIRVVAECKPRWFIGENVDGLVNIQDGMVLRQVQDDLEKEGFQVQCLVIPASGVGAWHQRKRVWIIGHNVSHTNDNGLEGRQFETRNEDDARENNTSIWRKSTNNISGSSDDRGDKTKSRIDESVSRSYNGNEEKPTTTERLCYLSEKSDECDTINQTSADKENNDRTLVQKRQVFQLSNSRGLGNDQAAFERNKIRQGDDNTVSHRVDTNHVSNTIGELSDGCSSTTRVSTTELERLDSNEVKNWNKVWSETKRCSEQVADRRNVSDSDSSRFKKQWQPKSDEKKNKTAQCRSWWQTQSKLCGVPDGISYELDKDRANRIKSLGNSIVPQIAEQLFKSIIYAEQ